MARTPHPELSPEQVSGGKYLRRLMPLLERLRGDGADRDRAGNRRLHCDHYVGLILLSMFSPALDSLRALQRASELEKVRRLFGGPRVSLGSLSEAARVFDPALVEGIVGELAAHAPPVTNPRCADPRLENFRFVLTAVDGTLIKALPKLAETFCWTKRDGKPHHVWRLHADFDLELSVPLRTRLTPGLREGERAALRGRISTGKCYILDRGFIDFGLLADMASAGNRFVCRLSEHVRIDKVIEERELSRESLAAGVVRDAVVELGGAKDGSPKMRCRLVSYEVETRGTRGRRGPPKPAPKELISLATNVEELPPELTAVLYRFRWSVELFFRFFKRLLGCRHLFSTDSAGIRIQVYSAIIACLLMGLWTGAKPTKATLEMAGHFFCGWASEAEFLAHLAKVRAKAAGSRAKAE